MIRRGPRRNRRRSRAAALGTTLQDLADSALIFPSAVEVPPTAPPEALPSCCTVTRTRRISIGGTVVVTVHQAGCALWGNG